MSTHPPQTPHVASQARGLAGPPVLAIASGKGGVGKTVVAVNLGVQFGRSGYRPLLVDLDPGLANCAVHLRLAPQRTLDDVVHAGTEPQHCVIEGPAGMSLLPGSSASEALAAMNAAAYGTLLERLTQSFRGHGLVVLDNGAGIGPGPLTAIQRSDLLLLVTTPEPGALTDAYALLKVMQRTGIATPTVLCINRVRGRDEALRAATRLRQVVARYLGSEPPELVGWLTEHHEIERSVRRQLPLLLSPNGSPGEDLRAMAAALLARLPAVRRSAVMTGNAATIADRSPAPATGR
jgi:flagellar biosynthesis protein FlhG